MSSCNGCSCRSPEACAGCASSPCAACSSRSLSTCASCAAGRSPSGPAGLPPWAVARRAVKLFDSLALAPNGVTMSDAFRVTPGNALRLKLLVLGSSGSVGFTGYILGGDGDNWSSVANFNVSAIGDAAPAAVTGFAFPLAKLLLTETAGATEIVCDAIAEVYST